MENQTKKEKDKSNTNMRPIKFRLWTDGASKSEEEDGFEMVYFDITEADKYIRQDIIDYSSDEDDPVILMQFTGLTDKNGKEIYEGDILRWINWEEEATELPDAYVVSWFENGFVTNCYREGKVLFPENDPMRKTDTFEVIGNIYENPELLK